MNYNNLMIYTLTLNPALDRELTVPAIAFDTVLRAGATLLDYGGKGFNVSRLLQGLGAASNALGFLGGKAGETLRDGLQTLGIDADFVWIEGETRTNISIVTPSGEHYLKVNEAGPAVSPQKQQELLDKIERLACPGDWWVLAGSLPPGVPDSFYARLIGLLKQHGAHTLLDSAGEPLRLGCLKKPFLVKPNREEAVTLTGLPVQTPAEAALAAAAIHKMGAENVLISLGKAGALLHTPTDTWLAHSPSIVEKNPIGAGDSMLGGLVWALAGGLALKEAFAWSVACGSATASLSGTEVASRWLAEELLDQIKIESLDLS